jgi:fluoride exporter
VRTALVALAGALGAVARYRIGLAVGLRSFPWATLGINAVGCALLGLLLGGPFESRYGTTAATVLAVGFLGAFTTFSTFGYETFTLLRTDRMAEAVVYVTASVAGGMVATAAGYAAGRALW